MEDGSSSVCLVCELDATLLDSLLHFFAHDRGLDEPGSNDIHSHSHSWHRSAHTPHDTTYTPFAGTVLRRTGLIQIPSETGGHDQASIASLCVAVEIMDCEFRGIHYANEVGFEDLKVWFDGLIAAFGIYTQRQYPGPCADAVKHTITPHGILSADTGIRNNNVDAFARRFGHCCLEEVHLIRPSQNVALCKGCIIPSQDLTFEL